jgi:hypothetical protein
MSSYWLIIMQVIPIIWWQVLWLLGLGLIVLCVVRLKYMGMWVKILGLASGCLLVLVAAFFLSCYAYAQQCCWVQLLEPMQLHAGPTKRYHSIATSNAGELVCVDGVCGEWKCIQARVCRGWVYLP